MTDNDLYYRHRIEQELAAADSTDDVTVSRIHRDMAQLYRDLLGIEPPAATGTGVETGTVFG